MDEEGERGLDKAAFMTAFAAWAGEHAGSHVAFLARDGEVAVGMAWLVQVERIPGPGVWRRVAGHLQSVYVLPAHRREGVGRSLVAAVIDEARTRGFDYVSVHPSAMSVSLYRDTGFQENSGVLELDLRHRQPQTDR